MSDKSGGVKQKQLENSDKGNEKQTSGSTDNSRSPVSESGSSEKSLTPTKYDPRARNFDRRSSPKPPPKGKGVFRNGGGYGGPRTKREEERGFNVNAKTFRRLETKAGVSPSPTPLLAEKKSSSLTDVGRGFSDESRLSKMMRRITREADRERRLAAAKQLKEYLHTLEGGKSAVKSTDDALTTLQGVFFERGYRDVKTEVALCLGAIGSSMGQEIQSYFHWLFTQIESLIEDEVKSFFLLALLETLRCDEKRQAAADVMQFVMEKIKSLLENADTPELLIAVVDVIMFIAKTYPHIFSQHFRDTVDILVGWHIDATQKEVLIRYTSQALVSFHMFWTSDLTFSLTLLGQFLEDMEAYAEDLNLNLGVQPLGDEDIPPEEECVTKISALLRVFTTVIQSLGDSFSPTKGGHISKEYVYEVLEKIVRSVENATKCLHSEIIYIAANNCLGCIVSQLQNNITPTCEVVLPFITKQLFLTTLLSKHLLVSVFSLVQKVVEVFGPQLPVPFLSQNLGPSSLLHTCTMSHSGEVLGHLMSLYHVILGLKSVPLLEESYRLVRCSVETCYNKLLAGGTSNELYELLDDNPFSQVTYSIRQAEAVILFDVCALTEIGNTKSNLIGMWALSPSVFDLLSSHLRPADPWIAECYPAVQYTVVYALYSHCCRHSNFTSSSSLLTQPSPVDSAIISSVSMVTSGHFVKVLTLIEQLLASSKASFDVRCLVIKWISEIVTSLLATPHIFLNKIFLRLVRTLIAQGYNMEHPVFMAANHCLMYSLFKTNIQFPKDIIKLCVELCAFRLTDVERPVREAFSALLKMMPLDVVASNLEFEAEEDALASQRRDQVIGLKAAWLARRNHIGRQPMGTFHSHNYRHVMAFLLHNIQPGQQGVLHWLEAMYHSAQRSDKEQDRSSDIVSISDMIDGNESLMWFWATWEAANFCVLARLRTPLGKPQETFMSIESVLKSMAAEATKEETEETAGTDTTKGDKCGENTTLLRVHLLLQFMEHLEKLLYNAYEGCAVAMPTPPKSVRTFFRTNRNTCQEWIARIRVCIIKIAVNAGMSAMAARQAFDLLKDMVEADNTHVPEFEQGVVYLIQALCDLRSAESVVGVYNWCRDVAGRKFTWIKCAAEKAHRRYEVAAREFKTMLKNIMSLDGEDDSGERSSSSSPEGSPRRGLENKTQPKTVLSKNHEKNPGTMAFMVNEIMDSYVQLSDWDSVMDWQEAVQKYRSENTLSSVQKAFNSTYDMNYIKALSYFDSGDLSSVRDSLELVPGASILDIGKSEFTPSLSWKPRVELDNIHLQFLKAATVLQEHKQTNHRVDISKCLTQAERSGEGLLRFSAMDWPPTLAGQVLTELNTVSVLQKHLEDKKTCLLPLSDNLLVEPDTQELGTYMQTLRLLNLQLLLPGCDKKAELKNQLSRTLLAAASLSRKQHSFELAEDLLVRQVITLMRNSNENGRISFPSDLVPALASLRSCSGNFNQLEVMKVERESAKLLHDIVQPKEAVEVMSSSVTGNILLGDAQSKKILLGNCSELCSRSLLTLVKWLQTDSKMMSGLANQLRMAGQGDGTGVSHTVRNLKLLMEMEENGSRQKLGLSVEDQNQVLKIGENPILSESDSIVGRLLHLSAMESPKLAKAWFTLAGWCYKWGRKAVDNASHGSVELSVEEKAKIVSIIPKGTSSEEMERVMGVLSQIHSPLSSEEDISDQDQSLYDDGTETTRKQLLSSSSSLQVAREECVDQLLAVWQGVVQRVYHYYKLSGKSYFTFLQLNGMNDETENADCNIISTLRLLRLLVKHAWELRSVLEGGLAETPTTPWKGIIPQLFSRLSHPEGYVRQSVSDLLCRVAQDAPHLIVYPAVVGSSANKMDNKVTDQRGMLNNYLTAEEEEEVLELEEGQGSQEDEEEDIAFDDPSATMLQTCLATIVDTLSHHNPRMISEVQLMVQELRRITLLWDELWLGTLNQQHTDVVRSIAQMETEIKKVNSNQSLNKDEKTAIIKEKHKTIMKPILYTMERLHEITSQLAETPHERWFQDTYGDLIESALEKLSNPSNPSSPSSNWQLFKQLHVSLQQRAQKRNSLHLNMQEISPRLSSLTHSVIPMPGLGVLGQVVTLQSVHNLVQILPTKTKPKKLVLLGSDGRRYPYLFKGLEDLHLDERIMQFLSIVNNMFSKSNRGNRQLYRARHYSVTPLGPRSGLIQWVEGATPLFALYKKWQQREAVAQTLKTGGGQTSVTTNTIPRPSEIYYNKLTPALKDKGIDSLDSRKEWPLSVLRKVLEELMEETPSDLLARELWCASSGPNEWWQITQMYARSTAVMSMIGYIIGLGDRHLDNVLVDLATGEIVHIDYNVCFEKGKGLRVPERVPFRMTQNIETALGVTGVEGTFRTASEHVMKTMRKGRETLLTLLEAFVYDPLVDWTTGNEGGYTGAFYGGGMTSVTGAGEKKKSKKDMEREITCSMFAIRVMEMRTPWTKNREDILKAMPELMEDEESWVELYERYLRHLSDVENQREVKQLLVDAQTDNKHSLFSLHTRYAEYSVVKATKDSAFKAVEEKINEFSHWQKMHKQCLETIQGSTFQKMCAEVAQPLDLGSPSFSAATEFLQGAGQGQIVGQCEQLESEMSGHLHQRRTLLHSVFEVLHSYSTMVSQFGTVFADEARTSHYLWWLQDLICGFTTTKCTEISSSYQDLFDPSSASQDTKTRTVMATETRLHAVITDTNAKILKLLDRRAQETQDTPSLKIQCQESERNIQAFVQESGMCGMTSLICVIVSALCSLNKRYIMMEGAASGAGDRLMDLTSRDGDWFLDELSSMSGNVSMFLDTLKNNTMAGDVENFRELHHALMSTHNAYIALQDLNINFRTIILPETVKLIQAQERSLLESLSSLENLLGGMLKQPLDALISQLEVLHRNAVMGIENDATECLAVVKKMQNEFGELLQGSNTEVRELTSGQMLLMGFNGLFTRLENEFVTMLEAIDAIQVPDIWRKVDVVKEAKSLQLSSFTSNTRSLLSSLFFLKRLQAMQEFFHMVTQFAAALQGLDGGVCYDDEQMAKPIKKFIADYVGKQVIGFPSQILGYIICVFIDTLGVNVTAEIELKDVGAESKVPLDDLCKKAVDQCLRNSQFQHVHLTQATTLTGAYDAAWRKHDLARRLDSNISLIKTSLQRCQPQVARFQWLHEDLFTHAGYQQFVPPVRASIMSDMRKGMQSLLNQEGVIASCEDRYGQLEASITQRLRWAAGANPTLNFVQQQFEEASSHRRMSLETESKLVTEVVSLCQGILHFEALRTRTAEAISSDTNFLTLINRCNECCVLMESSSSHVSDLELRLMTLRPISGEESVTDKWLSSVVGDINKEMTDMDTQSKQIQEEMEAMKATIQEKVSAIKTVLTVHHKLMSDLRSILKSMAKQEEQDYGDYIVDGGIREYLSTYKNFSEKMTAALKTAVSEDMTKEGMQEAKVMLQDLISQIPEIYDNLLEFAPPLLTETEEEEETPNKQDFNQGVKKADREVASPARRLSSYQRDLTYNTPPYSSQIGAAARAQSTPIVKKEKVARDPRTGKAIQERNTYAVGVWRRVKVKLDGRDPDANKRMSVAEQVDFVLKEATHRDNLAVLYEGWTPWV